MEGDERSAKPSLRNTNAPSTAILSHFDLRLFFISRNRKWYCKNIIYSEIGVVQLKGMPPNSSNQSLFGQHFVWTCAASLCLLALYLRARSIRTSKNLILLLNQQFKIGVQTDWKIKPHFGLPHSWFILCLFFIVSVGPFILFCLIRITVWVTF